MTRIHPALFWLIPILPMLELYVLIQVGSYIGALTTVLLVLFTATLGIQLIRYQGFTTWQRATRTLASGQAPAVEMMEGVILLVAGILLLTPGFISDTLGFLALVPPLRRRLVNFLLSRMGSGPGGPGKNGPGGEPKVIDGEFTRRP